MRELASVFESAREQESVHGCSEVESGSWSVREIVAACDEKNVDGANARSSGRKLLCLTLAQSL